MKRILLAAVIGGLVAFVWSAIDHTALPLGTAGIRQLPHEEIVLAAMKLAIPESGLYLFPWIDMKDHPSKEERQAWETKMRNGPDGMLIYHAGGGRGMSPKQLILEFLSDVFAALIAAIVLTQMPFGRMRRALTVMSLGIFAWLAISFSYWNWYGFPGTFVLAEGFDQLVGWFLGGLAMAGIVKPSPGARATS